MGRALRLLACDNCIPGDASGWYVPLGALVLAAVLTAAATWRRAGARTGWRAAALRLSGLVLLAGPPAAVLAVASDVTYGRTHCGSALSASLERGVPDGKALDPAQAGCKDKGDRIVAYAYAYTGATFVAAAVAAGAGSAPGRRRPAVA
ncbi:MAG TPA: hypothetical protein VNA20_01910 [Frankiaceae bacterium]|nr:hypothetical protein [Frankiaceae bacterium]